MKNLKCDLCEIEAAGDTFEEWMKALMPHYMESHADFMKLQSEKSEAEQKEQQTTWMTENKKRFEEA